VILRYKCFAQLLKAGAIPVGAALAGDGPQSGPDNLCNNLEIVGPLRGPSPASAALTSTAHAWTRVIIL